MDPQHPRRRLQNRRPVLNTPIRQWLLVWQISALIVVTLVVTLTTYHLAWDGFNRIRDYSLEQIAHAMLFHPESHNQGGMVKPEEADQFVGQAWNLAGEMIFASQPDDIMPRQKPGLTTLEWHGQEWHVMVVDKDGLVIQVASSMASRYRMFNTLGPYLLLPFAVMIFVLGGLIMLAVNRALQPLIALRDEVRERSPEHLGSLPEQDYPAELVPVVDALNGLLGRVQHAFNTQRRFIADAAHELRSPLTAIRLQAQVAAQEDDRQVRGEALALMQLGVDRATRLVEQLLALARFDHAIRAALPLQTVDLAAIAKIVIIEKSAEADAAGVDLGLVAEAQPCVSGDAEALRVMFGNLIDNAIRHAAHGGVIDVEIGQVGDFARCAVVDRGPGIPAQARAQVLEPFSRLAGQEVAGSGLGLAIVAEIVLRHGGTLALDDTPGGGLTVRIDLPQQSS